MFRIEGEKIRIDEDFVFSLFYEFFESENKIETELIHKAMERFYEIENKIYEELKKLFGSIEKAYDEYYYGDRFKVLSVLYEIIDEIIDEIYDP